MTGKSRYKKLLDGTPELILWSDHLPIFGWSAGHREDGAKEEPRIFQACRWRVLSRGKGRLVCPEKSSI